MPAKPLSIEDFRQFPFPKRFAGRARSVPTVKAKARLLSTVKAGQCANPMIIEVCAFRVSSESRVACAPLITTEVSSNNLRRSRTIMGKKQAVFAIFLKKILPASPEKNIFCSQAIWNSNSSKMPLFQDLGTGGCGISHTRNAKSRWVPVFPKPFTCRGGGKLTQTVNRNDGIGRVTCVFYLVY